MKKILFLLWAYSIFAPATLQAQSAEPGSSMFKDKWLWGGNFGLTLGTITNIEISPMVGLEPVKGFIVATGLSYRYVRDARHDRQAQFYGGNIFSQLSVFGPIFAHAELELLNVPATFASVENERLWTEHALVGGGLRQGFSQRGFMYIAILWNLTETIHTPYTNPVMRMGFVFTPGRN